jgi:hypothetical protein
MNTTNMPGFTAETSLYKTSGHYQAHRSRGHYRHGQSADSHGQLVVPAATCDECEMAADVCEANCYDNVPPGRVARCLRICNRALEACFHNCTIPFPPG